MQDKFVTRGILVSILCLISAVFIFAQAPATTPDDADDFAEQWPIQTSTPAGQLTIFQPQMETFEGDTLTARAAVAVDVPNSSEPVYGAVWFKSRVDTDRVSRVVQLLDVNVTQSRFPGNDERTAKTIGDAVGSAIVAQDVELSLDQLLAMVENASPEGAATADLENNPPKLIFRDHPAIKVQYDGDPKLMQVVNSDLLRVGNTPFFVVLDPSTRTYFLKGGTLWFEAPDPMGPFKQTRQVPQRVSDYAAASDYTDPQQPVKTDAVNSVEIVTATEPTELIWTDGPAQMGTIAGTSLLYVTNTDSDWFKTIDNQQQYVLLSGRWYTSPNRDGPWTFVPPDQLPPDFAKIPPGSDQGDVLAHVANTQQADEAIADTLIPQTATIDRTKFEQPQIVYDGDPRFEAVDGVPITYAVNTPQSVVCVGKRYYSCYEAVWYESDSPSGHWDLCTQVPEVIYTIPTSCPVYPVRYVYVYSYTPTSIYCGYTPGYTGCFVDRGVVVYGTGRRYQPWWGRVYYPRPTTFGFAAHYNSYVGHWGFSFGLATGSGGTWIGQGPRSWGRNEPWFGYTGYRPVIVHRDVHEDLFRRQYSNRVRNVTVINEQNTYVRNVRNVNVYQRRQDVRPVPAPRVDDRARAAAAAAARDRGRPAPRPQDNDNNNRRDSNIFADRDGQVHRRTTDGNWQVQDRGQWKPENRPASMNPTAPAAARASMPEPRGTRAATPQPRPAPVNPAPPQVEARPAQPARPTPTPQPARGSAQNDDRSDRGARGDRGDDRGSTDRTPAPARANPAPAARSAPDLDRDARARDAGQQRLRNYERPTNAPAQSRSSEPSRGRSSDNSSPSRGDSSPGRSGNGPRGR